MAEPMKEGDSFSLEVGGPLPMKVKGLIGLLAGFIVAMAFALVYLVNFSLNKWGTPFDIHSVVESNHQELLGQHIAEEAAFRHSLEDMTYVMWVCFNHARQQDCKSLNLMKPESLKKKQRQD